MSIGDSIEVPYKLIIANSDTTQPVVGKAWITDADGTNSLPLAEYTQSVDDPVSLTVEIPTDRRQTPYVQVHHQVSHAGAQDYVVQTIPIRVDGLLYRQ